MQGCTILEYIVILELPCFQSRYLHADALMDALALPCLITSWFAGFDIRGFSQLLTKSWLANVTETRLEQTMLHMWFKADANNVVETTIGHINTADLTFLLLLYLPESKLVAQQHFSHQKLTTTQKQSGITKVLFLIRPSSTEVAKGVPVSSGPFWRILVCY